jgi:RNA polymerase sigma-70 factor (ECF subfamily)
MDPVAAFEEYRDRIYRYALGLVRDPAEADDLVQDTFLRAHTRLATLRDPSAVGTWLFRIATNLAHDRFRSASSRVGRTRSLDRPAEEGCPAGSVSLVDEDAPRVDEVIEKEEMSRCVRDYIDGLPDDYRAVILLKDLQGLTNPEIAEMLECSVATVKIRLHRARLKLKATLEAGCDLETDGRGTVGCDPKPVRYRE